MRCGFCGNRRSASSTSCWFCGEHAGAAAARAAREAFLSNPTVVAPLQVGDDETTATPKRRRRLRQRAVSSDAASLPGGEACVMSSNARNVAKPKWVLYHLTLILLGCYVVLLMVADLDYSAIASRHWEALLRLLSR